MDSRVLSGTIGKVTVGLDSLVPGKVRVNHQGEIIDLLAVSSGVERLEPGTEVIVVSYEDGKAEVMPAQDLLEN